MTSQGPDARLQSAQIAAIVSLVGKGMSVREITALFPTLGPADIRAALLHAAEVMRDVDASLHRGDPVGELVRKAQQNSGLSDEEAMELAVKEARAAREERAHRRT